MRSPALPGFFFCDAVPPDRSLSVARTRLAPVGRRDLPTQKARSSTGIRAAFTARVSRRHLASVAQKIFRVANHLRGMPDKVVGVHRFPRGAMLQFFEAHFTPS